MGEMMEMYLKALAARNAEARKPPQVEPVGLKEVAKDAVAKEATKAVPAPVQAPLPLDNKSRAAGEDWDAEDLAETVGDEDGMTEVVE